MKILGNIKFLDVLLSICWFLMDFLWFSDIFWASMVFATIGFIVALPLYFKTASTEIVSQRANLFWFLMNFNWFMYDWSKNPLQFFMTIFFFILGTISIIIYLYEIIKEHKEIENPLKRIK